MPPSLPRSRSNLPPARWVLRNADTTTAADLARRLGIHPAVARVLQARGWDPDSCLDFLDPRLRSLRDPFEMGGMQAAVERTLTAIRRKELICVFGDYDVDGVSSTAIAVTALRRLGADPLIFIPHRIDDGYGMKRHQIEDLNRQGVGLIVTVDNGITAIEEIRRARELGIDVVVTDHHVAEEELPPAAAIVNPNMPEAPYAGGSLCGAGVAFKFAHGLMKGAGIDADEGREFLKSLMDLVALGTVADVVPLTGENRVMVRFGLQVLAQSPRPGLRALLEISRVAPESLTAHHIGFALGPRINAAGRTEHAMTALELLLTADTARATELAAYLETLNRRRRTQEASILEQSIVCAEEQVEYGNDSLLVVAGENFHLGVVGIVASRLVDRYYRPSIVLSIDEHGAKGSARSIPGFDIYDALSACSGYLRTFGGHRFAAGLQLEPAALDDFRAAINEHARGMMDGTELSPEVAVDTHLDPDEFCWDFHRDLQRLAPFGQDNPQPLFIMQRVTCAAPPRIVGNGHLKLALNLGGRRVDAIGFNLGDHLAVCDAPGSTFDILCRPSENTWRGNTSLELEIRDLRPAGSA